MIAGSPALPSADLFLAASRVSSLNFKLSLFLFLSGLITSSSYGPSKSPGFESFLVQGEVVLVEGNIFCMG